MRFTQDEVLARFISKLLLSKSDLEFANKLVSEVIPLCRLLNSDLVCKWDEEREAYKERLIYLEEQVFLEIEQALNAVAIEGLIQDSKIKKAYNLLRSVLDFQEDETCILLPRWEQAASCLKELFFHIAESGNIDLLSSYIIEDEEPGTSCYVGHSQKTIKFFNTKTFLPSYFDIQDLQQEFSCSPAGSWNRLAIVDWGWEPRRRYDFRKKELHFNSPQAIKRSTMLLESHSSWLNIRAVKSGKENFFDQIQLRQAVSLIAKKMSIDLGIDKLLWPKKMKLVVEDADKQLRLIFCWANGIYAVYQLQYFTEELSLSTRGNFFKKLINSPSHKSYVDDVSGADAKKYLKDAKITGILDELFVAEKKDIYATLQGNPINLEGLSYEKINSLKNYLDSLTIVDWRKRINEGIPVVERWRYLGL